MIICFLSGCQHPDPFIPLGTPQVMNLGSDLGSSSPLPTESPESKSRGHQHHRMGGLVEHLVQKAAGELSSPAGIAGVILDIVPAAKPPAQFSSPPSKSVS